MKTVLRVDSFEDRVTPAAAIDTGYETYAWVLVNALRQNPAAFANNLQGLVNGTTGSAFGFAKTDPVITDLKSMIGNASNPANYGAAMTLLRATPGSGPLAWDSLLQSKAQGHNAWMEANGFAHTATTGTRMAIPGFSNNNAAAPDTWGYGPPTYMSWGEDIGWAVGSLSASKAAYNAGGLTLAGLYERAAFLDTVSYVLELNSGDLGHLENLLGRDSGSSASLPSYNVFGEDLHLYEAPSQYETQDGVPEAWIDTQRFGLYRPNGTGGFVSGVAYQDANASGFYDPGEGQAATVSIRDANGNGVTDTTNATGAFSDYLPDGMYTVTATVNGAVIGTRTVTVQESNAWADLSVGSIGRPTVTGPTGAQGGLRPTIAWSGVDGATSYQLQINDLTAGISNLFPTAATTATYWTPTSDLTTGHGYNVLVRALRGTTPGAWSNADAFGLARPTVTGTDPAPTNLRPTFSWTGIAGATYQLLVNDQSLGLKNIFPNAATTDTHWTVPSDLVSGRTYTWQVRAVNAAGLGAWTAPTTLTVARPVPTGPANGVSTLRPAFTWTPIGGATAYVVTVNDVSANKAAVYTGRVTDPVWTPPADLVSGRTYSWQVGAMNALGKCFLSPPATFAVGRAVTIGPGGPTATTQPTFTWAGLAGASAYQVRVDDLTTGQAGVFLPIVTGQQAWTPSTPLAHGHTYRWWVRAVTSGGPGIWYGFLSNSKDFVVT
jgi:hypothetical protein